MTLARMFHEVMKHSPIRADFVGASRDEAAPPEADGYFGSPDRHVREISGLDVRGKKIRSVNTSWIWGAG
jgi:hypothetical protein